MTNKETIIDGVDVAGCYFYYKGECRCEQNCIDDDKGEIIEELFYREPEHNKWECELSKNCYYKQLNQLKEDNEELKKQLQAQCAFTRHEQKLIYCVAYDETCKTGNDCKQEKCIFKDNIKLKRKEKECERLEQALIQIKFLAREFLKRTGQVVPNEIRQILQKISEVNNGR